MQPIGHDITFRASIYSDGQVSYKPGGILQAKCPTDISKFPFDIQECTLEIIFKFQGNVEMTIRRMFTSTR
jgi:hypothetical protein